MYCRSIVFATGNINIDNCVDLYTVLIIYVLQHLEIRNSLDIMHCEKKFAENILKTICGSQEKDSVKVCRDMQREGI